MYNHGVAYFGRRPPFFEQARAVMTETMDEATLHQLLERIARRDEAAFLELYAEYSTLVYSVAYHGVENAMDAEEVAQDVFLKLWNKAEAYNPSRGSFVTWLLTITRHTAIDKLRRRQHVAPLEEHEETLVVSSEDMAQGLGAALETLGEEQRQAIYLAYFHGLSHRQIAERLARPLGTVKSHIRQGMERLRELWAGEAVRDE